MKERLMKKGNTIPQDNLRPEYDLHKLRVRRLGPARKGFGELVRLAPDVAQVFPDAESVNEALRFLIRVAANGEPANRKANSTA